MGITSATAHLPHQPSQHLNFQTGKYSFLRKEKKNKESFFFSFGILLGFLLQHNKKKLNSKRKLFSYIFVFEDVVNMKLWIK
jgi:hypothetical protein